MKVYIYESSSFGGCYDYCLQLYNAYKKHPGVESCRLVSPANSVFSDSGVKKVLLSDKPSFSNPLLRKMAFLSRNILNPLILFFLLLRERKSCLVVLNDFEQLSVPIWAPLYRLFLKRHMFTVVLHDPDRDNYPPSRRYSRFCMKQLIRVVQFACYHEYLPDKPYYHETRTQFISIPHGLYPSPEVDKGLYERLFEWKRDRNMMSILGNIREEKNYELALRALKKLPDHVLLIAGSPANSSVDITGLKALAEHEGVKSRVLWLEYYLSSMELSACIAASDLILLYYKRTFTSQSGVLNLISPFKKRLLVSNTNSGLAATIKRFGLGVLVEPDCDSALYDGVLSSYETEDWEADWQAYFSYASWDKHVSMVVDTALEYSRGDTSLS